MKTRFYLEETTSKVYLEAETLDENKIVVKLAKRIKKPARAWGNFNNGFAWCWLELPAKKISDYDLLRFSSEG